ncbi:hypothetical protein [Paracoccus spongiarum]|uniref:Uncharacterized protein n=1 Tax=Paracoccus spongiarum TaxID=3064387 RepID=A0ABT9JA11_9RHOB|nr:hypothetical protein [Paracoccus sp. 2205BS29-5]MDP5305926.1 hypothetical protein [Paracoccus sp. 2205BS29-5]
MIAEVIEMFMVSGPAVPPTDPLLALLTQAAKTTYLGSPKVVSDPIQQILPASVAYVRQEAASPPSGV